MFRAAILLLSLFFALPASAATLADVREVVACDDASDHAPTFTDPSCRKMKVTRLDPQGRQLWVRAFVDLPNDVRKPLGIRIAAAAAGEAWWNGVRLGSNGTPGVSAADESPGLLDAVWPIPDASVRPGRNVIVLRLSSWHQPWRNTKTVLHIGVEDHVGVSAPLLRYYLPALPTAGVFALAALFFGAAWLTDRREKGALALATLSAATLLQLAAEVSRAVVALPYPWQEPRLAFITLCACVIGLSMLAFAAWHYRRATIRRWLGIGGILMLCLWLVPVAADKRSLLALSLGAVSAMAATGAATLHRGPEGIRARILITALAVFVILLAITPDFLDATLYLTLATLSAILFANQILLLRRTQRAANADAARAAGLETALLRQSIAPHFLLNTLNSLIERVETDPPSGVRMIELLGAEYRTLSEVAGRPSIPLIDEIGLCRAHLELMAYRTDALLGFTVDGDPTGLDVPPGVLLTLVENALIHGRYADGASFLLAIGRRAKHLASLELITPPTLRSDGVQSLRTGTGLAYVRAQVVAAFGAAAAIEAGPINGDCWRTAITTGIAP